MKKPMIILSSALLLFPCFAKADWSVKLLPKSLVCDGFQIKNQTYLSEKPEAAVPAKNISVQLTGSMQKSQYKESIAYKDGDDAETPVSLASTTAISAMVNVSFIFVSAMTGNDKNILLRIESPNFENTYKEIMADGDLSKERSFNARASLDNERFSLTCKISFLPSCEGTYDGGFCTKVLPTKNKVKASVEAAGVELENTEATNAASVE